MKGQLILENNDCFEGIWSGDCSLDSIEGEVVFFTGMTGYQEVLTDPSFKGQIVVFTYPLIGNYGINENDFECKTPQVKGVIINQLSEKGHHYECEYSLKEYLDKWDIPFLTNVDTRAVVKRIRTQGVMGGLITKDIEIASLNEYKAIEQQSLVKEVSVKERETFGEGDKHIVLLDFGYKKSIVTCLNNEGCKVTVVPYNTSLEEIVALNPDGIMLSNGPGDPKQMESRLQDIKTLATTYPTLAICLGHQLLALAFGGDTEKLKFGHRGANQPVIDVNTKKVFMTSQNHSYVVTEDSLGKTGFSVRYKNVNDGSVEGIMHPTLPIFSVQFHPEAHPGPSDSAWIFKDFIATLNTVGREKVYA